MALFKRKIKAKFTNVEGYYKINNAFCIMPWVHLHVTQEGFVTPCCQAKWDKKLAFGDINQEKMLAIWKGRKIEAFRQTVLSGKKDTRCSACFEKEADGWVSLRQITNNKYAKDVVEIANGNKENYNKPIYLDIRFSNKCNLRCRICGPWASSNWANDFALLNGQKYQGDNITYGIKDQQQFLNDFREIIPFLQEIYFAGGEPLLIDANYNILQMLIDAERTDVALFYNSNLTVFDYKERSITDVWRKFKKVTIAASIDDFGEAFEYQRKNAHWEEVVNNLREIRNKCPEIHLIFSPTVSVYNIYHLSKFHREMVLQEIIEIEDFIPTLLVQPAEYNIQIIPQELKAEIRFELEQHLIWLEQKVTIVNEQSEYMMGQFRNVITYMMAQQKDLLWQQMVAKVEKLDKIRGESFFKIYPEYEQYKNHLA